MRSFAIVIRRAYFEAKKRRNYAKNVIVNSSAPPRLDLILRERRLRWFGHVERSSGAIRNACDIQIDGRRGAGRPKLAWKKLTERDCREWKPTTVPFFLSIVTGFAQT